MCGIIGFVGNIFTVNELKKKIKEACLCLNHRGPDEQEIHVEDGLALGVARLAIRDPINGRQPMTRHGYTIVFNGELYDIEKMKNQLESLGCKFITKSDTEVLLYAYIHYGEAILEQLTGMFAFAIWDSKTKVLIVSRDRWGEKPLYYTFGKDFFLFASELKALMIWPNVKWKTSLEDINVFLRHSYLPAPRTGWEGIYKLEPGCCLAWESGKISKKKYYCPKIMLEEKKSNFSEEGKQLFSLLDRSVKNCLVADKPVGAFLSGGIDSTTIVTLMCRYHRDFPVFSIYWNEESYSEEKFIQKVVDVHHLNHHKIICTSQFFQENFEKIVNIFDEPFGDESMVPSFCLAAYAKNHVDVVITGDGSDEFFHGYKRYGYRGKFIKYLDVFAAIPKKTKAMICTKDFLKDSNEDAAILALYSQSKYDLGEKRVRSWIDIHTYLSDDILTKLDRVTMSVGLEARAPFLTSQVTDFALKCSLPHLLGRKNRGKEILRLAMKDYIPKLILERKKVGFGAPLKEWFRSSSKEWMKERLLGGSLLTTGWFSREGIQNLIAEHILEIENHSRAIFNLLVLETWLRAQKSRTGKSAVSEKKIIVSSMS